MLLKFDPKVNKWTDRILPDCPNFVWSEVKCKCNRHADPVKNPPAMVDSELIKGLQALRNLINKTKGKKPNGGEYSIGLNCIYRCPLHNAEVGGVKNSTHTQGKAADTTCGGLTIQELADFADKIPQFHDGGIGRYFVKKFVHVDVSQTPKKGRRWIG